MAKKKTTPATQAEKKANKGQSRIPQGLRKHIRRLKSEGRHDEAAGVAKTANDRLDSEHAE